MEQARIRAELRAAMDALDQEAQRIREVHPQAGHAARRLRVRADRELRTELRQVEGRRQQAWHAFQQAYPAAKAAVQAACGGSARPPCGAWSAATLRGMEHVRVAP